MSRLPFLTFSGGELLLAVIIEALAGLLAELAAANHLLEQQSGTILRIAGLAVDRKSTRLNSSHDV